MKLEFFDAIVFLGFVNAFVFAGVILFKKPSTISNQILAFVLLILGLLCAKILLHTLNLWQTRWFRYFPLGIDLFLQPLLFLYVLALTEPQKLNKNLLKKHLILPILFLIYTFLIYFSTVFIQDESQKIEVSNLFFYDKIKAIEDILSIILGVYYGLLAYNQLKKYKDWVETYISNTAVSTYDWLRNLLIITAFILLFLGLMIVSQQFHIIPYVPIQVFYFYLVFLIYVFGFFGFKHQDFKVSLEQINRRTEASNNAQFTELLNEFEKLLKEKKLYLETDLNLNQCASKLDCSAQTLSEAINLGKNKNFRDYINQLRIEEFKSRILKANLQKETIMGVAYECGFNSEASFYRIFKEKTGIAPKEFLNKK